MTVQQLRAIRIMMQDQHEVITAINSDLTPEQVCQQLVSYCKEYIAPAKNVNTKILHELAQFLSPII